MLLHPETRGSARDTSPRCGAACKQRGGVGSAISLRDNCDHLLSPPRAGPNSPSSFSCTKLGQGTGPINMPSCLSARGKNTNTATATGSPVYGQAQTIGQHGWLSDRPWMGCEQGNPGHWRTVTGFSGGQFSSCGQHRH